MVLSLVGIVSFSQESATQDYSLSYDETWHVNPLSSTDYITTGDSIWYFTIKKQTKGRVKMSFRAVYDSIGGTADSVLTEIKYKRWLGDPWTTDYSFVYHGTVDTALTVDLDTARTADYWQLYIKGYSDSFQMLVDSIYFKFTE